MDSSLAAEDWSYSYDALGRLTFADNSGNNNLDRWYSYDLADNLTYNSELAWQGCAMGSPNISYPAAGSPRPHAPSSICGVPVTYDANGNTLSYDIDGSATTSAPAKTLTYDSENRPLTVTANGVTSSFTYDPEGERASKTNGSATTSYLGNDVEWLSAAHADQLLCAGGDARGFSHPLAAQGSSVLQPAGDRSGRRRDGERPHRL